MKHRNRTFTNEYWQSLRFLWKWLIVGLNLILIGSASLVLCLAGASELLVFGVVTLCAGGILAGASALLIRAKNGRRRFGTLETETVERE